MDQKILEVKSLEAIFNTSKGTFPAVDSISFNIKKGEIVALVGESGSGKSVTARSIMGLIELPGKISKGEILFEQENLVEKKEKELLKLQGNDISMIFQDPLSSLNPVLKIGDQIIEGMLNHKKFTRAVAKKRAIDLLKEVGIPNAERTYNMYPHSLSGGMRQRVMISIALACNPKLLIADEPTTALDVTIQAQILHLMKKIIKNNETSILIITHDMGVVAEIADRVLVMYAGQIIEENEVDELFNNPKHPYTKGLLNSIPNFESNSEELNSIKGNVPAPYDLPKGCSFNPRCEYALDKCFKIDPPTISNGDGKVKCWFYP